MLEEESKRAQEKYVECRLQGMPKDQAVKAAGYSAKTSPLQVENSPRVKALLDKALADHGLDEDWLAGEYRRGMEGALQEGAKDRDHNAHAQYLKNLSFLMGYGNKSAPSVAVQINNHPGESASSGPEPTAELIGALSALVDELRAAARKDEASGVHADGAGASDAPACPGVAGPAPDAEASGGGGGA